MQWSDNKIAQINVFVNVYLSWNASFCVCVSVFNTSNRRCRVTSFTLSLYVHKHLTTTITTLPHLLQLIWLRRMASFHPRSQFFFFFILQWNHSSYRDALFQTDQDFMLKLVSDLQAGCIQNPREIDRNETRRNEEKNWISIK